MAPLSARTATLLPAELWDHVLAQLDPAEQQHTALALHRALPAARPSPAALVRHLVISRPRQAARAAAALRPPTATLPAGAVRTATVRVWRDDPQLLLRLLLAVPRPRALHLTLGPLASPDHLQDLVDPQALRRTGRWRHLQQLALRFNPYSVERSYHTFLKGAYYDIALLSLAQCDPHDVPELRRLSFIQDLPPTYGAVRKETPAFGLHELEQALDDVNNDNNVGVAAAPPAPAAAAVAGKWGGRSLRPRDSSPAEFAQPIIFFQLGCVTRFAVSPVAARLTRLTFRLPRRALLPALVDAFASTTDLRPGPFPGLTHLDLSTTYLTDDARVLMLLRVYPRLQGLVLDRCSGLVSRDAVNEPTAHATLRWLGKCVGGAGLARADESLRLWRRIAKARPAPAQETGTGLPEAPDHSASPPPPPVRDVVILPPVPSLRALGLGLHSHLAPTTRQAWTTAFEAGYRDASTRATERAEEGYDRWRRWEKAGRLDRERDARVVVFRDQLLRAEGEGKREGEGIFSREVLETILGPDTSSVGSSVSGRPEQADAAAARSDPNPDPARSARLDALILAEPDLLFRRFCTQRQLVPLPPACAAAAVVAVLVRALTNAYAARREGFSLCLTPDCSDRPGRAHLVVGGHSDGSTRRRRRDHNGGGVQSADHDDNDDEEEEEDDDDTEGPDDRGGGGKQVPRLLPMFRPPPREETREEWEARERVAWREEKEEECGLNGWRRPEEEHTPPTSTSSSGGSRCAHLIGRRAWDLTRLA